MAFLYIGYRKIAKSVLFLIIVKLNRTSLQICKIEIVRSSRFRTYIMSWFIRGDQSKVLCRQHISNFCALRKHTILPPP